MREHAAAVPAHELQVQPAFAQPVLVTLIVHASAVPLHVPDHLQPGALAHRSAVECASHAGGEPLQAAFQVQPELSHEVETTIASHAVAVPAHFVPFHAQPATLPQSAEVVSLVHAVGVPEQVSVATQPLSVAHSFTVSVVHAFAVPPQTAPAPADPATLVLPPVSAPAAPAPPVLLVPPLL